MLFSVFNRKGIMFNVKMIYKGDKYGLDNCLAHDEEKPLVEFYDSRYPHTELGQFVSRYYAETLLDNKYSGPINAPDRGGLNLHGGVDDWSIDQSACEQVVRFINHSLKEQQNGN